jgi:hypothetical protein
MSAGANMDDAAIKRAAANFAIYLKVAAVQVGTGLDLVAAMDAGAVTLATLRKPAAAAILGALKGRKMDPAEIATALEPVKVTRHTTPPEPKQPKQPKQPEPVGLPLTMPSHAEPVLARIVEILAALDSDQMRATMPQSERASIRAHAAWLTKNVPGRA